MDKKALKAFYDNLDRSLFLDGSVKNHATLDSPLPIGFGQTISQPSLVYKMTELLSPQKDSKVLEIGTGSGYQTAFLAEFANEVYTIEVIEALSKKAKKRLGDLGYNNIFFRISDGSEGWSEASPFDRIIITAAAGTKPTKLINQLAKNGRMIFPVGTPSLQDLVLITKDSEGEVEEQQFAKVRFVEMIGEYGWG
ncbi:MAG: protein-L-isoaspartate(D-aspartate) O-methyltransferase [Clostridiaceae bacterium]|nr:protein-L-isoaspartate(D-aspartate) O-methyltransferase [Clostridiaceae bacterium]